MIFNIKVDDINLFIINNFAYISLSFISILLSVFIIRRLIKDNLFW